MLKAVIEGMGIYLAHTDALGYGDDGSEEFAMLALIETDGGEFFVTFEST